MSEHSVGVPNLAGWLEEQLGVLCQIISRGTAPSYVEDSPVKAIGQRCVQNFGFDASQARPHDHRISRVLWARHGDVLLNSTGTGTIGRSCIFDRTKPFMVDSHVTLLRVRSSRIDSRWLNLIFRSPWGQRYLESFCYTGSTNQIELSGKALTETRIPVPPLEEQRRIAEILDALDSQIEIVGSEIRKYELFKSGVREDLFRSISAPRRKLLDVATLPNGQVDPRVSPYQPLIAPDHVERNTGRLLTIKTAAEQDASSGKYAIRSGDVVYSKIRPALRKAVISPFEGLCSADMYPFRAGRDIDPRFLLAVLLGDHFSVFADAISGRSGIPKVNREELKEYAFPLPELEKQRQIADVLDAVNGKITSLISLTQKIRTLKEGLMGDLLSGRVRVPEVEAMVENL